MLAAALIFQMLQVEPESQRMQLSLHQSLPGPSSRTL